MHSYNHVEPPAFDLLLNSKQHETVQPPQSSGNKVRFSQLDRIILVDLQEMQNTDKPIEKQSTLFKKNTAQSLKLEDDGSEEKK